MFERCIYFNTNALVRKINNRWDQAFAQFDLSPAHGYLLRLILENPGLSQRDIAEELRLDKSTVTRFIEKLEQRGLLIRQASEDDQREKVVHPTKKAQAIQNSLESLGDELYATMCSVIGKKNMKDFVTTVREISDRL